MAGSPWRSGAKEEKKLKKQEKKLRKKEKKENKANGASTHLSDKGLEAAHLHVGDVKAKTHDIKNKTTRRS